jgi:hypothetical protein
MKTLRRPMFRKGGEVGGGIMTGVMRENYKTGTPKPSERIRAVLDQYSQPAFDPISKLLIEGGMRTMNIAGQGGLLGNISKAFEGPTSDFFEDMSKRKATQRDIALEGVVADIGQEQTDQTNTIKKQIADEKLALQELELKQKATQFNKEQQTKIDVEIQKGKNKIAELEFKLKNPGANITREQVVPAFENVVDRRTETYAASKNPAVKLNPGETAYNITRFRREANPEILSKFKGFKPYTYSRSADGAPIPLPTDGYAPGDIIYDPITKEFEIFDNAGGTFKLNKLTFEIQEGK